jgi:hypothetical protein
LFSTRDSRDALFAGPDGKSGSANEDSASILSQAVDDLSELTSDSTTRADRLDGTIPTRTRGYVYCGIITAQPGMTIKAVAYESDFGDSHLVEAADPPANPE